MLLWLLQGCAGGPRPLSVDVPAGDGVRVLFRVESEGPSGRSRFRMAAALRPPAAARLEFLGPVGGTRLVLAMDGDRATAILPSERQFDTAQGDPASLDRLLGLPLDGERLVALLSGTLKCRPPVDGLHPVSGGEPPASPATSGSCPPGGIAFSGAGESGAEPEAAAVLRHPASGAIIAEVRYGDRLSLPGGRWPRDIRVDLASEAVTISLTAVDGPAAARLPDDLFDPVIPDGFERRPIFVAGRDPALYGAGRGERR